MARETLWPVKQQQGIPPFAGNINFDLRYANRAVPSFDHTTLTNSADILHYFVNAHETQNPSTNPRQYAGGNATMYYAEDGARNTDQQQPFADVVQGSVICDNGSGVKILLVGFGNSGSIKNAKRSLTTDTTPWTTTNAAGGAAFWLIIKSGPDIYAVTNAGATILGEYHVSKCPAGNDPTLATSWGAGFSVGTPEWAITGLANIGTAPVPGKPDGLYYWDDQTKRFENKMIHLIDAPNAVTGKGTKSVTNGVMFPTHDGKLYFFDAISTIEVTPEKHAEFTRDEGLSRITAIADNGDTVAVVRECFQNTIDGQRAVNAGLKVITYINGAFTDVTSTVTDGNLTTGAAMATWGAAANDRLYIGLSAPWEGAVLRVTRNANAAVQSFATPSYSNGTTGTVAPFTSSFTAFTSVRDGTILGTAGVSLAKTGYPPSASNAILTWTDNNAFRVMTSTQLQFGGGIGNLTKYWAVWGPVTATGMTNPTTIDEVEVVYGRAAPPIAAANNFVNRANSGCITKVLLGRREKTVGFSWFDVYALDTGGGVWAMAWTSAKMGGTTNGGQALMLWGRYKQMAICESVTRDPGRTTYPMLVQYGTTKPGPLLNLTPGGMVLQNSLSLIKNRHKKVVVNKFVVLGEFAVPPGGAGGADKIRLYLQQDQNDIVLYGEQQGFPAIFQGDQLTFGTDQRMYAWLEYQDTSQTQPTAPIIREVLVDFDEIDEEFDYPQAQDFRLPEST